MNISIEDAIDLHRCIEYMRDINPVNSRLFSCNFGVIDIKFIKDFQSLEIWKVYIDDHESLKAKEKLQEYFDE